MNLRTSMLKVRLQCWLILYTKLNTYLLIVHY